MLHQFSSHKVKFFIVPQWAQTDDHELAVTSEEHGCYLDLKGKSTRPKYYSIKSEKISIYLKQQ